jgi:hypothetical protein
MDILINFVSAYAWFEIATTVIAIASVIAAATPTPSSQSVLGKIYGVIDFLAINFGKAKDSGTKSNNKL